MKIVAGDTKVVNGNGELYINTAGVGFVPDGTDIAAGNAKVGDAIIVSGNVGDHHAAILSERMNIDTDVESDNAPLVDMVKNLLDGGIDVHTLRDVTRGGLATVLKELSGQSHKTFVIEENKIPVTKKVADFAGLLGLDPLYMGNEGKLVAIVPAEEADHALDIIRHSEYGENATIIGKVTEESDGRLIETTELGGERELDILQGEGLPRIC